MGMHPKARSDSILVNEVDDELVVYDTDREVAHRLNAASARVWQALDGGRSIGAIGRALGMDESVVALAVRQLDEAGLLEKGGAAVPLSRRTALRRVATAAAAGVVLPTLVSIPAPQPAAAQSSSGGAGVSRSVDPPPGSGGPSSPPRPPREPGTPRPPRSASDERPLGPPPSQTPSRRRQSDGRPVRVHRRDKGRGVERG